MSAAILLLALRLLLALALYAFLAVLLLYLWRDLRAASLHMQQVPYAFLSFEEPSRGEQTFKLDEINLIGRAPDNSIAIRDETVSAHHARLTFIRGQWWLEDLGSRNGTRVNEIKVEEPLVLAHYDRILLGKVALLFHSGSESGPGTNETPQE